MQELKLGQKAIDQLLDKRFPVVASIYMPMHGSAEPQAISEDTSRLNSMLHRLKEELSDNQRYELRHRLDELHELVGFIDFWRSRTGRAIAFFLQPDQIYSIQLPLETSEHVFVDTEFTIGPLLTQLIDDTRYYALLLNQTEPKLKSGSRSGLRDVSVPDLPGAFEEALNIDERLQRQQQFHTGDGGSSGRAMFHGHGAAKDKGDNDLAKYIRLIRDAIKPILNDEPLPLILVGTEKMVAEYRNASDYNQLLDKWVSGNYEQADQEELHQRTWPLMERYMLKSHKQHLGELEQMAATQPKRVALDIEVIKTAALAGKVHKLFLSFTEKTKDSVRDGMANAWLDRFYQNRLGKEFSTAMVAAWKHRGEIIFADKLPRDNRAAAILRY